MISATVASRSQDTAPPAARAIVRLGGALDTAAAPALRDRLLGILHHGTSLLILDLSRVLRCDLAGLNVHRTNPFRDIYNAASVARSQEASSVCGTGVNVETEAMAHAGPRSCTKSVAHVSGEP